MSLTCGRPSTASTVQARINRRSSWAAEGDELKAHIHSSQLGVRPGVSLDLPQRRPVYNPELRRPLWHPVHQNHRSDQMEAVTPLAPLDTHHGRSNCGGGG